MEGILWKIHKKNHMVRSCDSALGHLHHRVSTELSAGLVLMSTAEGCHSQRCQLTRGHSMDSSLAPLSYCWSHLPEMKLYVLFLGLQCQHHIFTTWRSCHSFGGKISTCVRGEGTSYYMLDSQTALHKDRHLQSSSTLLYPHRR